MKIRIVFHKRAEIVKGQPIKLFCVCFSSKTVSPGKLLSQICHGLIFVPCPGTLMYLYGEMMILEIADMGEFCVLSQF